ncbi:hypothetical protein C3L33_17873, partial [Rhododendron williamsianum]
MHPGVNCVRTERVKHRPSDASMPSSGARKIGSFASSWRINATASPLGFPSFSGFTGGDTGVAISKKAGMVSLQMELGGKDACIVLEDADLDLVAANIIKGGLSYSGQRCSAVKVVLAMESIADSLVEKVNAKVAKLTVGSPEVNCDITPVVTESSANFIEGLVMDGKKKGATFCQEYKRDGNLIWPLLLDNVRPDMRIAWEEPFGPVLPVIRINTVEEVIHHCNASNFGLQDGMDFESSHRKKTEMVSYLETLDLKHTRVTTLPKGIFQLCNLRHLLIYWYRLMKYATWDFVIGVKIASGISGLTNLQKLSLIKSDKHHEIVKELGALTQLRKLGLVDLKREGGKYLCASVEKMKHLSTLDVSSTNVDEFLDLDYMQSPPPHLQRLYLKGLLRQFPGWISKLDNLFRIRLKWSRLQNSPLHALQELPNLLELEMVDAFTGDELVFEAGGFKKLKILHIKQFEQLNTVVVEQGAMPMLQKLSLWKCMKLEMLPLGIDKLTQIEELLLSDMPVEFTNRLQQTHEDHEMVRHIRFIKSFVLQADGCWPLENPP